MERKIGEIFEYNGEWYQCIVEKGCKNCAFNERKCYTFTGNNDPIGDCSAERRTDKYSVIFKKLEKAGEPITVNGKNVQLLKTTIANCDNCAFYKDVNCDFTCYPRKCHVGEEGTYVEIKTKEDMEEKKTNFVEAIDALCKRYNMSDGVRTDFMSELKEIIKDKEKCNLKPFNLEAAKAGKPVCTRDGRKARIICFDLKNYEYPIVAAVGNDSSEILFSYTINGKIADGIESDKDLMMLPEKKEGWINVYKRESEYICENECNVSTGIAVYKSEGEAKRDIDKSAIYINTIKINWEE